MPGEATETVPVTEQEMQQPQVETGSYILTCFKQACLQKCRDSKIAIEGSGTVLVGACE